MDLDRSVYRASIFSGCARVDSRASRGIQRRRKVVQPACACLRGPPVGRVGVCLTSNLGTPRQTLDLVTRRIRNPTTRQPLSQNEETMTHIFVILILLGVAGFGLLQTINQYKAHEQLEQDRRQRYMQRFA
jgi:hypothetical protein